MKVKHLLLLLVLIIISACQVANAKSTKNKLPKAATVVTWEKEPDSFFGIKFGKALSDQMPECSHTIYKDSRISWKNYDHSPEKNPTACWEKPFEEEKYVLSLYNTPSLGFHYSVYAKTVNGLLEMVGLTFYNTDYPKVLALFKEKYGDSTITQEKLYQNRSGMTIKGIEHSWIGVNINIILSEYGDTIDEGAVHISTKALNKSYDEEIKNNSILNKDKL